MSTRQRIAEKNVLLLDLWHQSQIDDSVAFCRLADELYRTLFNYAHNFTGDRELIKDCIQDLFLHIWERRRTIEMQFVSIYFLKSLRNQLLQEFRRRTTSSTSLDLDDIGQISDYHTVETEIERNETSSENQLRVRTAIELIPKRQREIIFLKFYEGLNNEQIAELMQVNRQSVANLVVKALSSLKMQIPTLTYLLLADFAEQVLFLP